MGYAKEFNRLFYNVPEFLMHSAGWEDVSYRNDVCPRFENKELGIAVWVEANEPSAREYEEWAQYTVVAIKCMLDDTTVLCDDELFQTEVIYHIEEWINMYETKMYLEIAFASASRLMTEEGHDIADELASLIAQTQEVMDNFHDYEVPSCSPSGEPM
jgi:hypothetical protein